MENFIKKTGISLSVIKKLRGFARRDKETKKKVTYGLWLELLC